MITTHVKHDACTEVWEARRDEKTTRSALIAISLQFRSDLSTAPLSAPPCSDYIIFGFAGNMSGEGGEGLLIQRGNLKQTQNPRL